MTVRQFAWSASLGLAIFGGATQAAEPGRLDLPAARASTNQDVANALSARLRSSGLLKDYQVEITVAGGNVELSGTVADQPQREEVLRLVQGFPSVSRVIDRMTVASPQVRTVRQTDGPTGMPVQLPPPLPGTGTPPAVETPKGGDAGGKGGMPEPAPIYRTPISAYSTLNPPYMPPYAWPTYAPYNNYSRVAYPTAYPYHSWPFIGPVYPYPKVPPGWRSVKLEWDDGYWWFSRVAHPHDWWKLRYW